MVNCYEFCIASLTPTQQGSMHGDFTYHLRKKKTVEERKKKKDKGRGFFYYYFCEEALMDSQSALAELGVA